MNKAEYISLLEEDILTILQDRKFNNNKKQIFAWKLNASFQRTYDEQYLWNRCLNLSSNACIILQNDINNKQALKALKECGEIYEYLSHITEYFDCSHILILSAFCYNISGYQANAFCIVNKIPEFSLNSIDEKIDLFAENFILEQIRLILLNKIPLAKHLLNSEVQDLGLILFSNGIMKWYNKILLLEDVDYIKELHKSYQYYLNTGNVFLSQLILLLETRLILFNQRSIWNNLENIESLKDNIYWQKYAKLLSNDIYSNLGIKELPERNSKYELWISQQRAIEKGLLNTNNNYVVQMPTSAGKTFVAELAILRHLLENPEKKCIYVAPFRALTSEKENELSLYFSKLGYSVSSLTGSYEIDEFQDVILEKTDILVATPEKIDLLLRLSPDFFSSISFLVVDEGHIIGDITTRAILLEFLLIRLRIKIPGLKTLFISAVMPPQNADEYSLWLSGDKENVLRSLQFIDSPIGEEWEPTRKLISKFVWEGNKGALIFEKIDTGEEGRASQQGAFVPSFLNSKEIANTYPKNTTKNELTASLAFKISEEGNVLVFCSQVRYLKSIADKILSILFQYNKQNIESPPFLHSNTNKSSSYYSRIWYGEDSYITKAIDFGIGIHFGDMSEPVRNAVENDFRLGNLRILLATNTIGQGVNFPIKNLIIYDMCVGRENDENQYIAYRDFWNIIGRVGRAGKETEGRVIYVVNSPTDKKLFENYVNKSNIENANSLLFKALSWHNRIGSDKFEELISSVSETYLLDLITEESIETDFQEIIEKIINNSLFKVQIDAREIDIQPLRLSFSKIYNGFKEQASFEQLDAYRKTGFSFQSNKTIDNYIKEHKLEIQKIIEEDSYLDLINIFIDLLYNNKFGELSSYKLERIDLPSNISLSLIKKWIKGNSLARLRKTWQKTGQDMALLNIFISEALYYLYPWGITTFITLICSSLKIEPTDLSENIKNLSSYVKFGINIPTACLARSLGIKSREVAILLHEKSGERTGVDFIKWLSNLSYEEVSKFDISEFERNNVYEVSSKLTPNSFKEISKNFCFSLKGITFNDTRKVNSKYVEVGERLTCERDYQNQFDPYAIKIFNEEHELGFIPREYTKIIASDIDVSNAKYRIIATQITIKETYNEIEVIMNKIE